MKIFKNSPVIPSQIHILLKYTNVNASSTLCSPDLLKGFLETEDVNGSNSKNGVGSSGGVRVREIADCEVQTHYILLTNLIIDFSTNFAEHLRPPLGS